MSQLHGKQLRNESTSLNKLSGTGLVAFTTGATMSFDANASLKVAKVPTTNNDVVNKAYVDSVATGLDVKQSARAIAHDVVITLNGVQTVDGVSLVDGDRVVVNGQDTTSATASNGIYIVNSGGAWTRSEDFDESEEITGGQFIFITEGTNFADTGFVVSTPDAAITVGVEGIKFTQFSSAGLIQPGDGLSQTGNIFDVNVSTGLEIVSDNVRIANTGVSTGSQGSATSVSTFTVNAQGQLTAAGSTAIAIPSTQVTDFDTAAETAVFQSANFVNSTNIDFSVTTGATVSADLTDTNVVGGSYGTAASVASFTVDGKGRLTAASNTTIDITASQVSNFTSAAENAVFQPANFIDSTTIDFTTAGGTSVTADIKDTISGSGLTFSTGVLNINVGDGIAISNDNVVVDLANNSGLTLSTGKLEIDETIAGTGLTFSAGVLSIVAGSAQPEYLTFSGTSSFSLTASQVNNFSRLQAFINGLEASIGTEGSGVGVAGLPDYTGEIFKYDGTTFVFDQSVAGYALESSDEVRIVFEKG